MAIIDVHRIETGSVVTVAHPDPEPGLVYLVLDEEPPPVPHTLTLDAVNTATQLPDGRRPRSSIDGSLTATVCAFLVGAISAPFLAVPNPLDYARLLVEGRTDEVRTLDHPVLFRLAELQQSIDNMVQELGHDTVYQVTIHEVMMTVEVPVGDALSHSSELSGADAFDFPVMLESDRVVVRDHRIIEQEPDSIGHLSPLGNAFSLSDVNWPGVYEGLETAQELAVSRGLADAKLNLIRVTSDTSGLDRIEVDVSFAGELVIGVASCLHEAVEVCRVDALRVAVFDLFNRWHIIFNDDVDATGFFADGPANF